MWQESQYCKAIILRLKINKYILKKEREKKKCSELPRVKEERGQARGVELHCPVWKPELQVVTEHLKVTLELVQLRRSDERFRSFS